MTNAERKNRGMTADDLCLRCHRCPETIMHLLKDCEEVKDFWPSLINLDQWSSFFSIGLHNWLDWNLSSTQVGILQGNWLVVFGVAINNIWKDRNSMVFSQTTKIDR